MSLFSMGQPVSTEKHQSVTSVVLLTIFCIDMFKYYVHSNNLENGAHLS